jgi:hypothetical protein
MKTLEQINRKINRIKPEFDKLNDRDNYKTREITKKEEHRLYELGGMLIILDWIK